MLEIGAVDRMEIVTLVEDYAGYDTHFLAQHGVSFLLDVEAKGVRKRILMDAGQSAGPILHNMDLLGLDPTDVDVIFLSHSHADHTKGLAGMLRAIEKEAIPVVAHPTIFRPNYALQPCLQHVGITGENSAERIEELGGCLVLVREPFELFPGVLSTGEVEMATDFEMQKVGLYNVEDGSLVQDQMLDDMSLVVNVRGKGLVVVTGCGHAGIVNIVKHARAITGIDRIEGVIGGLHLIEAGWEERIEKTAAALPAFDPGWVIAGHCTGFAALKQISTALGDRFSLLHAGKRVRVEPAR